jgi:hypothetical protein
MQLSKQEQQVLSNAMRRVWNGIYYDVDTDGISNKEAIELTIDANRLEIYEETMAASILSRLVRNSKSYPDLLNYIDKIVSLV